MLFLPPRKFLLLGFVLVLLLLVTIVSLREHRSVVDLSGQALSSLCNSARMQRVFPPPKRLTDDDFDNGMYSAGSRESWSDEDEDSVHWSQEDEDPKWEYEKSAKMINTEKLLKGNATTHFRDNLRPEYQYITGWGDGGFTNQYMAITNLLFLSLLTPHRVPIIPPLVSRPHLPVNAGYRAVSDVFDLDRWARAISKEVLEWKDVKDLRCLGGNKAPDTSVQADGQDEIGCWSVWATANLAENKPYSNSFVPDHLNLDISHTPIPREARLSQTDDGDTHVTFNALAILSQATATNPNPLSSSPFRAPFPNFRNKKLYLPDEHLVCYDFLYRVSTMKPLEWEQEFSSAWNVVGKHAYWNDRIRSLARQTIANTLGVMPREVLPPIRGDSDFREDRDGRTYHPHDLAALRERDHVRIPYIVVHARHGDFLEYCQITQGKKEKGLRCAPGLSEFERLIEEVEEELHQRGIGFRAGEAIKFPVIVTSDETDEEWWNEVVRYGWKRVEYPSALELRAHEERKQSEDTGYHRKKTIKNTEPLGGWPPEMYDVLWDRMFVEAALQGLGMGFVGTQGSTMSLVARRRVEHWRGGVTRVVELVQYGVGDLVSWANAMLQRTKGSGATLFALREFLPSKVIGYHMEGTLVCATTAGRDRINLYASPDGWINEAVR